MKQHSHAPVAVVGHYIHVATPDGRPSYRIAYQVSDGPQPEWEGNTARLAACWNAAIGLDIPESAPPGILKDLLEAARDAVHAIRILRIALYGENGNGGPSDTTMKALSGILAKLSTPAAGTPGPAPVSPALPDAVRAAFEEVRRYHPEICKVRFYDDGDDFQGWEFTTPEGDAPEFSSKVDTFILEKALDWVYSNFVFPTSFEYQEAAPVSAEIPPDRRAVWSFEVDGTHVRWCGTIEQFHADCTAYCDASQGTWENLGRRHLVFTDSGDKTKTHFRAVAAK